MDLSVASFSAKKEDLDAAVLQSEIRTWEHLALRQDQSIQHGIGTLEEAIKLLNNAGLQEVCNNTKKNFSEEIVSVAKKEMNERKISVNEEKNLKQTPLPVNSVDSLTTGESDVSGSQSGDEGFIEV